MRLSNVPFLFFAICVVSFPLPVFSFDSLSEPFLAVLFGIGSLLHYPPIYSVLQFWFSLLVFFYLIGLFFF